MIHICFALNDRSGHYAKLTGTAMLSIFDNTNSEVTVHILHDNTLTQDNHDKFSYLASRYSQAIRFYNVEELCTDKIEKLIDLLPIIKEFRYTIATFYRFFIPQVIPEDIEKVIYLDSDIIVNLDINDFWQIDLEDNVILGVIPEILNKDTSDDMLETHSMCRKNLVKIDDYFNAGVLFMNLKILRREETTISEGTKFYAEHPEHRFNDQDILNYCFSKRTLKLPLKFNRFVSRARRENKVNLNKIFHYIAGTLGPDTKDPFNRLWMNYFIKTPWFNLDAIDNMLNAMNQPFSQNFNQAIEKWKSRARKCSVALAIKTRVFVINDDKAIKWIKQNYGNLDEDEFIIYDGDSQKLLKSILTQRAKKFFFIRVGNLSRILTEQGLVEGEDFINSMSFLKISQSNLMDTHSLILAM